MGAIQAIAQADLLIVGGTSLTVYPAAGLLQYYGGNRLVLINRDATPLDGQANPGLPRPHRPGAGRGSTGIKPLTRHGSMVHRTKGSPVKGSWHGALRHA